MAPGATQGNGYRRLFRLHGISILCTGVMPLSVETLMVFGGFSTAKGAGITSVTDVSRSVGDFVDIVGVNEGVESVTGGEYKDL